MKKLLAVLLLVLFCLVSCNSKDIGRDDAKEILNDHFISGKSIPTIVVFKFKEGGFNEAIEMGYITGEGKDYNITEFTGRAINGGFNKVSVYHYDEPGSIHISGDLPIKAITILTIDGITSTENGTPDEKYVDCTLLYSFDDSFMEKDFAECLNLSMSSRITIKRYDDGWRVEKW